MPRINGQLLEAWKVSGKLWLPRIMISNVNQYYRVQRRWALKFGDIWPRSEMAAVLRRRYMKRRKKGGNYSRTKENI